MFLFLFWGVFVFVCLFVVIAFGFLFVCLFCWGFFVFCLFVCLIVFWFFWFCCCCCCCCCCCFLFFFLVFFFFGGGGVVVLYSPVCGSCRKHKYRCAAFESPSSRITEGSCWFYILFQQEPIRNGSHSLPKGPKVRRSAPAFARLRPILICIL